jgi:hypothetical protein
LPLLPIEGNIYANPSGAQEGRFSFFETNNAIPPCA